MTPSDRLVERVGAFAARHRLLEAGGRVDVALSGGVDSVALLAILVELAPRLGLVLRAHHVRHGLRPDDAADLDSARATAAALGVAWVETTLAPGRVAAAARGRGLEERAREARYAALLGEARAASVPLVATAHHGDDNLETLLVRLVRGAGLEGLAAMAPRRPLAPGVSLVRPLLGLSRGELEAFVQARGLEWHEDPSNRERRFLRNRVRADVVPALGALRGGALRAARRSVLLLREDASALASLADAVVARGTLTAEPAWYLELGELVELGPAAAAQVLRHAARRVVAGHVLGSDAVDAALRALALWPERFGEPAAGRRGAWRDGAVALGRDGAFAVVRAVVAVAPRLEQLGDDAAPGWALPEAAGEARWRGLVLRTWSGRWSSVRVALSGRLAVALPRVLASGARLVEARAVAAPLWPAGLAGRKSVGRAVAELGVPSVWRGAHPVLVAADGACLWLVGGGRSAALAAALEAQDEADEVQVLELAQRPWYVARTRQVERGS